MLWLRKEKKKCYTFFTEKPAIVNMVAYLCLAVISGIQRGVKQSVLESPLKLAQIIALENTPGNATETQVC